MHRSLVVVIVLVLALAAWWWLRGHGSGSEPARPDRVATGAGPATDDSPAASAGDGTRPVSSGGARFVLGGRGRVEGVVQDSSGNPVGGVDVIFRHAAEEETATADSSGAFSIELASGVYAVQAMGDRLIARPQPAIRVIPGDQPLRIVVIVERLATVRGAVVDHTGASVPDATVHFVPVGRAETALARGGLLLDRVSVDSNGRFEIHVLAREQLSLEARAGHLRGAVVVRDLGPGEVRDNLTIRLPRAIELSGRVVDPGGRPVAGAEVSLNVKVATAGPGQVVETGSTGRFVFEPVAPGELTVEARARGFAPSVPLRYPAGSARDAAARAITLELQQPEVLAGRVVDHNGEPLRDVRIRVGRGLSRFPPHQTATGGDGRFEIAGVDRGAHWIGATLDGFAATTLESIEPPRRDLEIVMVPHGGIRGTVADSQGRPLPSFVVRIDAVKRRGSKYSRPSGEETRFSGSAYQLDQLAPGRYAISITAPGHHTVTLALDVTPGKPVDGSAVMRAL